MDVLLFVMNGLGLISALEKAGFAVTRRAGPYVWLARGEQRLMIDASVASLDPSLVDQLLRDPPPDGSK